MSDYLFTLPDEVIASLQLRTLHKQDEKSVSVDVETEEATTSLGCSTCQIKSLHSVTLQRSHFKSDWHKYNLKHKTFVTEDQFDSLAEGSSCPPVLHLDSRSGEALSSLSGSDSTVSSSSDSQDDDATGTTTLKKVGSPLIWFTAGQNAQLGIYRAALPVPPKTDISDYAPLLRKIRLQPIMPVLSKKDKQAGALEPAPSTDVDSRKWAIIMVGGGHFAAMIVSLVPKYVKQSGKLERETVILESKTFHRYTSVFQAYSDVVKG
jgi:hypothetical protein